MTRPRHCATSSCGSTRSTTLYTNNRYPQHTISTPGTYTTPRQHHFSVNLSADIVVRSGVFATRAISRCSQLLPFQIDLSLCCSTLAYIVRMFCAVHRSSIASKCVSAAQILVTHSSRCCVAFVVRIRTSYALVSLSVGELLAIASS